MIIYGIVKEPSEELSKEEIEKAAHDWLISDRRVEGGKVVESYITPKDFKFYGTPIKEGSWIVGIKSGKLPKRGWLNVIGRKDELP
jgi:hypothetical protein